MTNRIEQFPILRSLRSLLLPAAGALMLAIPGALAEERPVIVTSTATADEVREFCTAAEQRGGLVVDNKSRIFKVIKTPVETEEPLPTVMRRMTGYEFFTFDNDAPLELVH